MDLIALVLVLALIGFVIWILTTYIPMPPPIKTAIIVVTAIVMVIWLLGRIGLAIPNVLH